MIAKPASELKIALTELRPYFVRAGWFSVIASALLLAPSGYMLEVYDRVVNARSHMTLAMLTMLVLGAYLLMEVLEWARSELMREAGLALDAKLRPRIFRAIFEANLKRVPGGSVQPMNDLRTVREFLYSPALLSIMEAPVALLFLILIFAISPAVEASRPPVGASLSSIGSNSVASVLPNSTPHWSNESIPHTVPCTKTLCS